MFGVREWKRRQCGAADSHIYLSVLQIRSNLSPTGLETTLRLQINSTQHTRLTSHPRYLQHKYTHIRMCLTWQNEHFAEHFFDINYRCVTNKREKPVVLLFSGGAFIYVCWCSFGPLVPMEWSLMEIHMAKTLQFFSLTTFIDIFSLMGVVSSRKAPPTSSGQKASLMRIKNYVYHKQQAFTLTRSQPNWTDWRYLKSRARQTIYVARKLSSHISGESTTSSSKVVLSVAPEKYECFISPSEVRSHQQSGQEV